MLLDGLLPERATDGYTDRCDACPMARVEPLLWLYGYSESSAIHSCFASRLRCQPVQSSAA